MKTLKPNQLLILAAVVLFALSAFTYRNSLQRAERFERGQKFLHNLNPDDIAAISVTKGDDKVQLRRADDKFVVTSANGYPAKNESVNRFIRDVLELSLEKEVGKGDDLTRELELEPGGESTIEVAFKDANDRDMVHFFVGKAFDDGSGNYIRRADGEAPTIYLTSSRVYLNTRDDDFLDKDIVDVKQADIQTIQGPDYVLAADEEGALRLQDLPAGKKESTKVGQVKSMLSGLRFNKHYLADDQAVRGLRFDRSVWVGLKDGSGYRVAVAERDGKHYLQIQGTHETAGQVAISLDASEEEVKDTSEKLMRAEEIQKFNDFHGSWIYEVTETTAGKVRLTQSDLVENA